MVEYLVMVICMCSNNKSNRYTVFFKHNDAASLFGPQHLLEYHPLFERNGTGVHTNWWGGDLMNFGWWQCAHK
jgi:hypothetical protein